MAKSVRLHHPTFASCNYVVELPQEMPFGHSRMCFACSRPDAPVVHRNKCIHLRLDENGDVFVMPGLLKDLRRVPTMAGLEVANGTDKAPPQVVGAVELLKRETIQSNGHDRFWVPGRTKYESRDLVQKPFQPVLDAMSEKLDRVATAAKAKKSTTFIFGRRK